MILGSKNASPSSRPKNTRCANCGSSNVSTSTETHRFTHGVGSAAAELSVEVPVRTCADCGTQFTDDEAERLRHDAVCRHPCNRLIGAAFDNPSICRRAADYLDNWFKYITRK